MGSAGQGGGVPALSTSIETQAVHCTGRKTSVTATIAPVTPERNGEVAPLAPDGEPEQPDARRDLGQQHDRPRGRVAEAERDGDGQQQMDVAVVEVDRHGRECEHGEEAAPAEPCDRGE